MEDAHSKIVITHSSGKFFVWSPTDVMNLRENLRICGSLVGSLPRKPWQNSIFCMPLILMSEEVYLCTSKGFAVVKAACDSFLAGGLKQSEDDIELFHEAKHRQQDEQIRIFKREKVEKAKLYYGRKKMKKDAKHWYEIKPLNKDIGTECKVSSTEPQEQGKDEKQIEIITDADRKYYTHSLRVHIPTEGQAGDLLEPYNFRYPKSAKEKLFAAVYEDLWSKGNFVTSAEKFGGDFLVYPGDPLRYHSKFIIIVMEEKQTLNCQQIVLYGRLGSAVKKTVALASIDDGTVNYTSLTWKK